MSRISIRVGEIENMLRDTFLPALTRRHFNQLAVLAAGSFALPSAAGAATAPDIALEIAAFTLEPSPKHHIRTVAYNGQVPGPLFRMREGVPQTVKISNNTKDAEIVHWHGLFLPPEIYGATEEGTSMIAPGETTRYTMQPSPSGFRWYHTHTFAGKDLTRAQFGGLHGFLLIEPRDNPAPYDREVFLGLHDWEGHFMSSDDGFMNPIYDVSTINGKMLGFGDPIKVKHGERVLLHILNSSPTEVHWISFSGHSLKVIELDGNPVPQPQNVHMLRLAPAERVSATVEMNNPGQWVFGEVRKHVQAAGMGIVFEYANATGKPVWNQPEDLIWSYHQFANTAAAPSSQATPIELVFESKFQGHGNEELWLINGLGYPQNAAKAPRLTAGQRYRLILRNKSSEDHPMHLHRHTFEVRNIEKATDLSGLHKDVVLVPANSTVEVEFLADHPGKTLFHCHQQDHMDRGFMMVFDYA
jgi:FtsP/CotA-like multicopper oxidase with cupredoxin domain